MTSSEKITPARRFRLRDKVRVVRPGSEYEGQTGVVTRADYERRVPLVVDGLPDTIPGIGICFSHDDIEMVEAAPEVTLEDEILRAWCDWDGCFFDEATRSDQRAVLRVADLTRTKTGSTDA